MGVGGAAAAARAARGQPRPSVARYADGTERCAVGVRNRRALARAAGQVPSVSDLPSALPTVDSLGQAGGVAEAASRAFA